MARTDRYRGQKCYTPVPERVDEERSEEEAEAVEDSKDELHRREITATVT